MIDAAPELVRRARALRVAAFDVDGVLTDGRLIFGSDGSEYKAFHVRDGLGLQRLAACGIIPAIITGRESPIVSRRMHELGINHVYQGAEDKLATLHSLLAELGIGLEHVAYMGDDLPDLTCLEAVGLPVTCSDACEEVLQAAALVTARPGGTASAFRPWVSALAPS